VRRVLAVAVLLLVLVPVLALAVLSVVPDTWLARGGYEVGATRLVTGMLVRGSPAQPVIYVSSSDPRIGAGESGEDLNVDTNSGVVTRLTREGSGWERLDLVRGLPRSEENHATNGLALDEGSNTLYVAQGGNTNAGAPSHHFAKLPEYALSGAVIAVDLARIGESTHDLRTLGGDGPFGGDDGRNQAVLDPAGPVEVFAPGFRNIYDLVFTQERRLYTIQNGGAASWGDPPANEGPEGGCTNEPREPGHYDRDSLHLVERGRYYGHPNPTRGNRANTFDGRSPVPRANPVECDYRRPAERDPVTLFRTSTNGLAEYTASNFGGALRGDLLAASLDGNVYRVKLDADGARALRKQVLSTLVTPLDVTAQGDDDPFAGTIWVARHDDFAGEAGRGPNLWVFEPADFAARWEQLAGPGFARQEVSFVRAGRRFYLTGGGRAQEVYDPNTDSWTKAAPLPRNLDHIQGVELGGRIYYVGGLAAWPEPAVGSTYEYDPRLDRFTSRTPMPRPRGAGGVAAHQGRIYYAGGLSEGRAVPWFDVYDPKSDSWSQLADMPRTRDHFHAVVAGGKLYAIGGRDSELGHELAETDVYDFTTRTWSSAAPIPTPRGGFAAALHGDEIYVIGGEDANGAFATVEAYDVKRDTWRTADPLPVGRHGIQAVVCGGAIYVAAGGRTQGGENPSSLHDAYLTKGARGCGPAPPPPAAVSSPSFREHALEGSSSYNPTAIQFGPDGRLYVAQQDGLIKVYDVVRRSDGRYAVTATEEITAIQRIPNHDDDGSSISDVSSMLGVVEEKLENLGL
jgi:Kelch motif/Glucose / Sorbosone dehydrogenase